MPPLRRPPLRVVVWTAATVALLVVATLLWRGSDAAATESTTAAPADAPHGTPAGAVSEAWSAEGDVMPETVVQNGRVLVGSAHGVRALDPSTGEEVWHYTRSNARMCGLAVTDGIAVAVFATEDRCDESVGLNAGTGVRNWTRSVNLAGDVRLSTTSRVVLASNPGGVVALDSTSPTIRWRYAVPGGCRLIGAAAGVTGVAVLEHCAGADGLQLRMFGGFQGEKKWNLDLAAPEADARDARLLGADGVVTVVVGGELQVRSATDGSVLSTRPAAGPVAQRTVDGVPLLFMDDEVSALDPGTGATVWTAPAIGLPTASAGAEDADQPASLLVPEADGFVRRDATTGAELGRSEATGVPAGGTASSAGPVVVYGLPDRVLAYR